MRQFNSFEKKAIRDLLEHSELKEQGMILFALYLESCYFGPKNGASLAYTQEGKSYISMPSNDVVKNREKFVSSITLLNLFHELRGNGLVIFLGSSTPSGELGKQYRGGTTLEIPAPINSFVHESLPKYIMVTEGLAQLVKDNFRSSEEKWHSETKIISYVAIGVSIALGFISIGLAYAGLTIHSS